MTAPTIDHQPQIVHTIAWTLEETLINFEIYDLCEESDSIEGMAPVVSGHVKWDGCSNWKFFPTANGRCHFCDVQEIGDLQLAMSRCYEITEKNLPTWFNYKNP